MRTNQNLKVLFFQLKKLTSNETSVPHSALKGATSIEVITGKWSEDIIAAFHDHMIQARKSRSETKLAARCLPCLA